MAEQCRQDIENDIERLPWGIIIDKINQEYQKSIKDTYSSQEVINFLKNTYINEVSYIPPVFGVIPSFESVTHESEEISNRLTSKVRKILEDLKVPRDVRRHFYVNRASIPMKNMKKTEKTRCKKTCCGETIIRWC